MARDTARTKGSGKSPEAVYEQYRGGKFTYKADLGTSAEALPATNLSNRKGVIIQNLHATQDVYIGCSIPEVLLGQLTSDHWRDPGRIDIIDGDRKVLKWTASGSGTNEYYATNVNGGDPGLTEPLMAYAILSDGGTETLLTNGTVGSLNDHEWDWGDNDSLGFSTVYFADATGDPDTETWFVIISYTWLPDSSASFGFKLDGGTSPRAAVAINLDGSVRVFGAASAASTTIGIWEYR